MALLEVTEATIARTTWSQKRVQSTKYRLERNFGKGLTGLINEEGYVDPDRLGWMVNKHNGKKPLGSTYEELFSGLTIDATNATAQVLGFVNGLQYEGLTRDIGIDFTTTHIELTNCFAATFAIIEDIEIAMYNVQTVFDEPGSLKWFDVLAMDPIHLLMDFTVEWQMCNMALIWHQFTLAASLDYAAVIDQITRNALVLFMESAEYEEAIKAIYDLADYRECTNIHHEVQTCFDNVNKYQEGKLMG